MLLGVITGDEREGREVNKRINLKPLNIMSDSSSNENTPPSGEGEVKDRRIFLQGMGKWSGAAIVAAVAGAWFGSAPGVQAGAWVNRRVGGGGAWVNGGGGGGGWINGAGGGGGWINGRAGGGAWVNRR